MKMFSTKKIVIIILWGTVSIESIETLDINFSDTSQSINKLQGNMFEFKIGSRNNIDAKMCVFINQNIIIITKLII